MAADILNPLKRLNLKIDGQTAEIEIRELPWPQAMEFLELLGNHFAKLVNERGQFEFTQADLGKLIGGSRELADYLVTKSTGKDLGWLEQRSPREVLAILRAAIPLNLSEEVINLGKGVAEDVQSALGVKVRPATSPASSIASSPKATR